MQWSWHKFLVFINNFKWEKKKICSKFKWKIPDIICSNVCICVCVSTKQEYTIWIINCLEISQQIRHTDSNYFEHRVSEYLYTWWLVEWSFKQLFRDVYHLICFLKWKFHVCSTCISECVICCCWFFFFFLVFSFTIFIC